MRVREIMSSPAVTVPPGMRLKEVADLLVSHGISAVPVVDGGELVGIVSEADLVPLELAPDPRAHLAIVARRDLLKALARGDEEIAAQLRALLDEELGPPSPRFVEG